MKILKYKKGRGNLYIIVTDKGEYKIYDDIIIKYELLLKKDVTDSYFNEVLKENKLLDAYYMGLKKITIRMRTEKELEDILVKAEYKKEEIDYAIKRLDREGYLNHEQYIEAYIHDKLNLDVVGEDRILKDLMGLGFRPEEVKPFLDKIDALVYDEKIRKYIDKKAKANRKSINEFKNKMIKELTNKGFKRTSIVKYLDSLELVESEEEIEKLVNKLYLKYIKKYDLYTTRTKIKMSLYNKGYKSVDIDKYIKKEDA